MSQTLQDPQPLQQTADRKHYHAPEFRDYGTLQDLTRSSESISRSNDNTLNSVPPGGPSINAPAQLPAVYATGGIP
jgi:hypothetical protein